MNTVSMCTQVEDRADRHTICAALELQASQPSCEFERASQLDMLYAERETKRQGVVFVEICCCCDQMYSQGLVAGTDHGLLQLYRISP